MILQVGAHIVFVEGINLKVNIRFVFFNPQIKNTSSVNKNNKKIQKVQHQKGDLKKALVDQQQQQKKTNNNNTVIKTRKTRKTRACLFFEVFLNI